MDCLGNRDHFAVDEKHVVSYFLYTYQVFGTVRNPAAKIKPISITPDNQTAVVFAVLPRQVTYDETYPTHLPGLAKTTP